MSRQVYGYSKEEKIKDLNKRMLLAYENDDTSHAPELKKMKILIVDDNQDVRQVLSELLTLEGQEAVTVEYWLDPIQPWQECHRRQKFHVLL